MTKLFKLHLITAVGFIALSSVSMARGGPSIPSVIVTVENSAPFMGAFQTPFWIGIHDGSFDIYNRDELLGAPGLVDAGAVESLAEDGNTGPISTEFSASLPDSPQATLSGSPAGPLAPGEYSSKTLNVDPETDRFFSYASMLIPSNDAFIANGAPEAHEIFDEDGYFVAEDFAVSGSEVLDAGTEVNDEIAANTAFLNQAGPNIGVSESVPVALHPGFLDPATLTYPDGVLNYPVFGMADFLAGTYRAATFKFHYVDLGRSNAFLSYLSPDQEVTAELIDSDASGSAVLFSRKGDEIRVRIRFRNITSDLVMAHLHLGQAGINGPVVVDLTDGISKREVKATIEVDDVVGPLATESDPFLSLLNELAAGNIYINLHTEDNPAGELRGQVKLQKRRGRR